MNQSQQTNPFIVLNEALPEIFKEQILELKITEKVWFFRLGDVTNNIWEWIKDPKNNAHYLNEQGNRQSFTFDFVCYFVGRVLDGTHGTSSIYSYATLAARIKSPRLREKFSILPISHFTYACQFADKDMIRVLLWDLEQADARGSRPISKLKLMQHFEPERFQSQAQETPPMVIDNDELAEVIEDEPFWTTPDLPINREEITQIYHAFSALMTTLQNFKRQNANLGFVNRLIEQTIKMQREAMDELNELLKEKQNLL